MAVHAALRIDAVVLLVPRSSGAAQVADIITRTDAALGVAPNWAAVTEPELSERCRWIELSDSAHSGGSPPYRPRRSADAPALVLYTSGTTSKPKGVIHSLSTLIKASANYISAAGLGADDRIFLISPLASVTGVLQAVFIPPHAGGTGRARGSLGSGRHLRLAAVCQARLGTEGRIGCWAGCSTRPWRGTRRYRFARSIWVGPCWTGGSSSGSRTSSASS